MAKQTVSPSRLAGNEILLRLVKLTRNIDPRQALLATWRPRAAILAKCGALYSSGRTVGSATPDSSSPRPKKGRDATPPKFRKLGANSHRAAEEALGHLRQGKAWLMYFLPLVKLHWPGAALSNFSKLVLGMQPQHGSARELVAHGALFSRLPGRRKSPQPLEAFPRRHECVLGAADTAAPPPRPSKACGSLGIRCQCFSCVAHPFQFHYRAMLVLAVCVCVICCYAM